MKTRILQILSCFVLLFGFVFLFRPLPTVLRSIEFVRGHDINYLPIVVIVVNTIIFAAIIKSGITYLRKKRAKQMLISCSIILMVMVYHFGNASLTEWLGPISILIPVGFGVLAFFLLNKHLTEPNKPSAKNEKHTNGNEQ